MIFFIWGHMLWKKVTFFDIYKVFFIYSTAMNNIQAYFNVNVRTE